LHNQRDLDILDSVPNQVTQTRMVEAMVHASEGGEWFTQAEIDGLAQSYAQGRLTEWMLLDALDDDDKLVRIVMIRSKDFNDVNTDEAVTGLI